MFGCLLFLRCSYISLCCIYRMGLYILTSFLTQLGYLFILVSPNSNLSSTYWCKAVYSAYALFLEKLCHSCSSWVLLNPVPFPTVIRSHKLLMRPLGYCWVWFVLFSVVHSLNLPVFHLGAADSGYTLAIGSTPTSSPGLASVGRCTSRSAGTIAFSQANIDDCSVFL